MSKMDSLEEVQIAFSQAHESGASVRDWIARYPEYALELAYLDVALQPDGEEIPLTQEELARADRAMRNVTSQIASQTNAAQGSPGVLARAEKLGLDLPSIAEGVRLSLGLLYKIDRGYLAVETLPSRLRADFARVLKWSIRVTPHALVSAPAPAHYSAKGKPQAAPRQSFTEALLADADISDADRDWWLSVIAQEAQEAM